MRRAVFGAFLATVLLASAQVVPAQASQVVHRTMADLIDLSEHILVGEVIDVRDGFDPSGYPYTEVTLSVSESLKGSKTQTYTFRQFGLLKPRTLADGRVYAGVSPEGWPRFVTHEKVMLFLYQAGSETGFRTTVGLAQGKFTITDGMATNAIGNRHLFEGLVLDASLITPERSKLLQKHDGILSANSLKGFVRQAVSERWIEKGALRYENR